MAGDAAVLPGPCLTLLTGFTVAQLGGGSYHIYTELTGNTALTHSGHSLGSGHRTMDIFLICYVSSKNERGQRPGCAAVLHGAAGVIGASLVLQQSPLWTVAPPEQN